MNILWGIVGVLTVTGIGFLLSKSRKHINPRTILVGLSLQIMFAFLALKFPAGRKVLEWLTSVFQRIIGYTNEGISFLFGHLVEGEGTIFAFQVLTVIIFFSSLISVLYYLGIMQWLINIIGGALAKLMKTSSTESLSAAANIFVGHTEAPLVVRPFLSKMTQSELFAIMVGGMGSVSGSVLVGYSLLGVPLEYLLAASFMAAPSSLVMAKIMLPQTRPEDVIETDKESLKNIMQEGDEKSSNIIDAAAKGASTGLKMAIEIAGMLLAFISLIALINGGLGLIGGFINLPNLTMESILGVLLAPISFLLGVPWQESVTVGQFIGQKIVINEFVAYADLGQVIDTLSDKAAIIASFALAGFANFGSIAIQIGALGTLAPNRRKDVSKLGIRAMIAGALASLLNAAIAGMFI